MHIVMVGAGAHGHIDPNLPVIAELVARGHRVQYAIPAPFADLVTPSGATPLVHTTVLPDGVDEPWPDDPVVGTGLFLDEGRHVTPQVEAALAADRPDVFLADIGGYAARVLGLRWGVPCVQLSPEALREAAAVLDTDAVRARCAAAASELVEAGGARRAADLVEASRS